VVEREMFRRVKHGFWNGQEKTLTCADSDAWKLTEELLEKENHLGSLSNKEAAGDEATASASEFLPRKREASYSWGGGGGHLV